MACSSITHSGEVLEQFIGNNPWLWTVSHTPGKRLRLFLDPAVPCAAQDPENFLRLWREHMAAQSSLSCLQPYLRAADLISEFSLGTKGQSNPVKVTSQQELFMGNHFIHISNYRLKTTPPTWKMWGSGLWVTTNPYQCFHGCSPTGRGISSTWWHQNKPQNTLFNCPQSPHNGKTTAPTLASAFPLPLPNSTLERTYKIAGHKGRSVAARLASLPIMCFSHVDFLCLFEGKEKTQYYCIKCTGKNLGKNWGDKHKLDNTLKYWN